MTKWGDGNDRETIDVRRIIHFRTNRSSRLPPAHQGMKIACAGRCLGAGRDLGRGQAPALH